VKHLELIFRSGGSLKHRLISSEFLLRSALFCDITQSVVLIPHGCCDNLNFSTLVYETDRFYRNAGKKLPRYTVRNNPEERIPIGN